jgi:hypothetical protein
MAGRVLRADDTELGFHAELDLTEGKRSTGEIGLSASTRAENTRFSRESEDEPCSRVVEH